MPLTFLQTLGLSKNEANLYDLLLKLGEVPVHVIVKESRLKRPTVYKTLYNLAEKDLVSQREVNKILHFAPTPPTSLLGLAETQYSALDRAKKDLQAILPELSSAYTLSVEKPIIRMFEGLEGLKEIYLDTLVEAKPIYAVVRISTIDTKLHEWLQFDYVKKRARKKIHAKVIVAYDKAAPGFIKRDQKEERTSISVPGDQFPFQHEVNIYGNKVAFINNHEDEPLIGFIIDHPLIAQTMKAWFDLAWIGAQNVKPQPISGRLG